MELMLKVSAHLRYLGRVFVAVAVLIIVCLKAMVTVQTLTRSKMESIPNEKENVSGKRYWQ